MKMLNFKSIFLRYFPKIGKLKRYILGKYDSIRPEKRTYSQHGEDLIICQLLQEKKLKNSIYIDVGANHPTRISNTYKLYRNGFTGICIEPNNELIKLHKKFRKRDTQVPVGCDEQANLLLFKNYNIPVLSGFSKEATIQHEDLKIVSQTLIPVLPVDIIMHAFNPPLISFLNIDVEGMDFQVLKGAQKTLLNTYLVCIEISLTEKEQIIQYLVSLGFDVYKEIGCNLLFINKKIENTLLN